MRVIIEQYSKNRHDPAEVKSLLALAAGRPTLDKLAYLIDQFYAATGRTLFICSRNNQITGIIGVEYTRSSHGFITHLAVRPDFRKKGIADRLIKHAAAILEIEEMETETDQDAVDFYNACGFRITEISGPYAGVRRFRCTKSIKLEIE